SELEVSEPYALSTSIDADLHLHPLLASLGLKKVPVQLHVLGKTKCQGQLGVPIKVTCADTDVTARNLHVYSGEKKKKIVALKLATAKGSFEVTDEKFRYVTDLTVGAKSSGKSEGVVNYKTGFHIFFEGPSFDFSDLENLSNLKLEGAGSLKG